MTYTESNKSFVKSILQPYFREAGIKVEEDTLDRIVDEIIKNDNLSDFRASNGHDMILQSGLNLLKQMARKSKYKS
ncbi:hypothetical protein [Fonticella tunisiensis]|uniref:Uncharacterized protein n=1 Tax=Fonticella tunisiensis TaxID=1096341 RepID=A0A4V3ERP0_9CLOT|nr:hypothetical protein [Fonticella tunisiensis]TDT46003.1 hypothetical protein EDD71_1416 [Fonticella tunisiensis]